MFVALDNKKREKKKREEKEKKEEEEEKREEEKRGEKIHKFQSYFQALLISWFSPFSFHLCLSTESCFYAGATPELESVYYSRIGTYMYILCTKQLLSNTDQAYIMYKYIRLICIEFVFMYILFCPAYDI